MKLIVAAVLVLIAAVTVFYILGAVFFCGGGNIPQAGGLFN